MNSLQGVGQSPLLRFRVLQPRQSKEWIGAPSVQWLPSLSLSLSLALTGRSLAQPLEGKPPPWEAELNTVPRNCAPTAKAASSVPTAQTQPVSACG